MSTKPSSRSEVVRRRQQRAGQQRFKAAAHSVRQLRPLVSRPRRAAGRGKPGPGHARSRFSVAVPGGAVITLPAFSFRGWTGSWRIVSAMAAFLLVGLMTWLWADPRFAVEAIALGGQQFVPGQEIYEKSKVANRNIFWVDPLAVQHNVEEIPGVISATVTVKLPNQVTILVTERAPVLMWKDGSQNWWVDADGLRFPSRGDLPGLLPIQVDGVSGLETIRQAGQPAEPAPIPLAVVQGALQLRELRPNIELLHYSADVGLSYQDGRNWRGYFGVGLNMPQKLAVYETLVDSLLAQGIRPTVIDVSDPLTPYYRR